MTPYALTDVDSMTAQAALDRYRVPEAMPALHRAHAIKAGKGSVWDHEALLLWRIARLFNRPGARFLEIGTLVGVTALMQAEAAPEATILTLNPAAHEVEQAVRNLAPYPRVTVLQMASWDYLATYTGEPFDLIFVDGDHARAARDVPWIQHVKVGGAFLWHDYDAGSPKVIGALDRLMGLIGRPLDIHVHPSDCPRGFVGLYVRDGDAEKARAFWEARE